MRSSSPGAHNYFGERGDYVSMDDYTPKTWASSSIQLEPLALALTIFQAQGSNGVRRGVAAPLLYLALVRAALLRHNAGR